MHAAKSFGFHKLLNNMNSTRTYFLLLLIFSICYVSALISTAQGVTLPRPFNNTISASFIFGDSTVDSGNNNYIQTATKSNFPPYGEDFENHTPTGRFTNGRLVTDFIVAYVGLKETVPPYLDPTLSTEELLTGVSFASAGTGLDPLTAQMSSVIPVEEQLRYLREYKARIALAIGDEEAKALISNAAFIISCGTNDFVVNYFNTPLRRYTYSVSAYKNFLLQNLQQLALGLQKEGAKRIALVGLPPMGCLPIVITLNGASGDRKCVDKYNTAARNYNQVLQKIVKSMQHSNLKVIYCNIYDPLVDMTSNPQKYGFTEVNTGCCGTGLVETGFLCSPKSSICSDASKKVFWDAVHPTEATYYNLFKALRPDIDVFIKNYD